MPGPAHILVVDDDQRLRDLLRDYLSQNGYLVTTAADAAANCSGPTIHAEQSCYEDRDNGGDDCRENGKNEDFVHWSSSC